MDTNKFNFERVWHGSHRSQTTAAWPAYVIELFFVAVIAVQVLMELH